jgi:hypothetical protein
MEIYSSWEAKMSGSTTIASQLAKMEVKKNLIY